MAQLMLAKFLTKIFFTKIIVNFAINYRQFL